MALWLSNFLFFVRFKFSAGVSGWQCDEETSKRTTEKKWKKLKKLVHFMRSWSSSICWLFFPPQRHWRRNGPEKCNRHGLGVVWLQIRWDNFVLPGRACTLINCNALRRFFNHVSTVYRAVCHHAESSVRGAAVLRLFTLPGLLSDGHLHLRPLPVHLPAP